MSYVPLVPGTYEPGSKLKVTLDNHVTYHICEIMDSQYDNTGAFILVKALEEDNREHQMHQGFMLHNGQYLMVVQFSWKYCEN